MKGKIKIEDYSIKDIIDYRSLSWPNSRDFLFLTEIPMKFEADFVRPDYYCFGMISQGQLEMNINGRFYNLSPNTIMIYRPGQLWKVARLEEGTKGNFILFTKRFLDSLNENIFSLKRYSFLSHGIQSAIELNKVDYETIKKLFAEIFSIFSHLSEPSWEPVARNLTSALIYECDNVLSSYINAGEVVSNREDELFVKFKQLLAVHFKIDRKPDFYASQLCITAHHMYTVIKKKSGKTPSQLIGEEVMREAKYQVMYSLASFAAISSDLNFSDPFTFSKYFKKNAGCSPLQFRKHGVNQDK
ncbi:helix-turn-helix domain-containing protein [Pedobacter sp. UBA5917]|jgi:AraC-like DNA-binding protein|uniref:helix-turn-helix domain-containing protein n=1 Tax=Pedobacter sp. UBA5917 TaxID=1947061 RepID=UPI0025D52ABB|nr:helix-turn-helix domain-containing protein [Pedobacter sp. UBA5917]